MKHILERSLQLWRSSLPKTSTKSKQTTSSLPKSSFESAAPLWSNLQINLSTGTGRSKILFTISTKTQQKLAPWFTNCFHATMQWRLTAYCFLIKQVMRSSWAGVWKNCEMGERRQRTQKHTGNGKSHSKHQGTLTKVEPLKTKSSKNLQTSVMWNKNETKQLIYSKMCILNL